MSYEAACSITSRTNCSHVHINLRMHVKFVSEAYKNDLKFNTDKQSGKPHSPLAYAHTSPTERLSTH